MSFAAEPATTFTYLRAADGLPSQTVWAIAQDHEGFIWFATSAGLARYDGFDFVVYKNDPRDGTSLAADEANGGLLVDRAGNLWVGTVNGLSRYDARSGAFERFTHDPSDPTTLGDNSISGIAEGADGAIWIGAGGLNRLDPQTGRVARYRHDPAVPTSLTGDAVLAVHVDRSGYVWVGTRGGGLDRLDPTGSTFSHFDLGPRDAAGRNPLHDTVRAIYEERSGVIWVGTDGGLNRVNLLTGERRFYEHDYNDPGKPLSLSDNYVNAIFEDRAGNVWIGTAEGGLNRYDRGTDGFVRYAMADGDGRFGDLVTSIAEDRTGLLWFAGRGVARLDLTSERFVLHEPSPGDSAERIVTSPGTLPLMPGSLQVDREGLVWIGTSNGLAKLDRASDTWTLHLLVPNHPDWPDNRVYALHDAVNRLYVGVPQGIALFMRQRSAYEPRVIELRGTPNVIHVDREGVVWAGIPYVGLARLPGGAGDTPEYFLLSAGNPSSLSGDFPLFIHEDRHNRFWVGTRTSLNRFDRASGRFERVDYESTSLRDGTHTEFRAVAESADGELWFGTDRGVSRMSSDATTLRHDLASEGLAHDHVNALEFDAQGKLWVGTEGGLSRLDPVTGEIRNFYVQHGLPDNEVLRLAMASGGELYVATYSGLASVHPNDLVPAGESPLPATNLALANMSVSDDGDSMVLTHRDRVLSFDLAVFDYRDPSKNRYSYKLEGVDRDWVHARGAQRRVTYTTLPADSYRFVYRGADSTGRWTEPREKILTVLPAPWLTWWAYSAYLAALVLAFVAAVLLRTRAATARALMLEAKVVQRTNELIAQRDTIERQSARLREAATAKDRLYADVSHEFRTPLTVILGPLERLLQREHAPDRRVHLETIRRNARRLLRLVEQLMDLARLDAARTVEPSPQPAGQRVRELIESFRTLAEDRDIELSANCDAAVWVMCDPDALEKIVVNLVSNAVKYTGPGGRVSVSLAQISPARVEITVEDTGIGIPTDRQAHVFERFYRAIDAGEATPGSGLGLALVKALVAANGGDIELASAEGVGTTVRVTLLVAAAVEPSPDRSESTITANEVAALDRAPAAWEPESQDTEDGGLSRALIIEDNLDLCRHVEQVLGDRFRCSFAHEGEEGLRLGIDTLPDVVICDVMLPKLNGFEVARQLKQDDRTCHIPIVLLTARADEESRITGLRTLADDYVTKPFSEAELRERVERLLAVREILRQRYSQHLQGDDVEHAMSTLSARDRRFIERAEKALCDHHANPELSLAQFASLLAMSDRQLQRKLKAVTNATPREYIRNYRLARAMRLLESGERASEVAFAVGFTSQSYFTTCFKARFGVTPTEIRTRAGMNRPKS